MYLEVCFSLNHLLSCLYILILSFLLNSGVCFAQITSADFLGSLVVFVQCVICCCPLINEAALCETSGKSFLGGYGSVLLSECWGREMTGETHNNKEIAFPFKIFEFYVASSRKSSSGIVCKSNFNFILVGFKHNIHNATRYYLLYKCFALLFKTFTHQCCCSISSFQMINLTYREVSFLPCGPHHWGMGFYSPVQLDNDKSRLIEVHQCGRIHSP